MHKPDRDIKNLRALFTESSPAVRVVSFVTLFRIVSFPILILLLILDDLEVFKWLLLICFLTDAVDGFLARKYKVTSVMGSTLDSVGDDLTIVAGIVGLFLTRLDFLKAQMEIIIVLLGLFLIQLIASLIRYRKISSFHTYLAKTAAVVTGAFMISMFFFEKPIYLLFYAASALTAIELIEEIILVFVIPEWSTNVRGLYWVLKGRKGK